MRLIDANKFREELKDRQWNLVEEDHECSIRMDEIGHWINKLDNEPTEEAIPIEWIEDWFTERQPWENTDISTILEEWRKENGTHN